MDKPFTVVLLRPKYLAEETTETYGRDIYVAHVSAKDIYHSVGVAQKEVFEADKRTGLHPEKPGDYVISVIFEDKQEPKLFGWQL